LKSVRLARLSDAEIDRIAQSPDLFSRIRSAAAAEAVEGAWSDSALAGPVSAPQVRPLFFGLRWQSAAAAFSVVLVFAAVAGLFAYVNRQYFVTDLAASMAAMAEAPPQISPDGSAPVFLEETGIEGIGPIEQRSLQTRAGKTARPVKTKRSFGRARAEDQEKMGEFQAVTYAGESNERLDTDRVVRVELSRASLFAMGVNIPVENETEKVKADLLIGFDGMMKGVRVEKR
jgi:hypothetical protein